MKWNISEQELEVIKKLLVNGGFNTARYKDNFMKRRIKFAFTRSKLHSKEEYISLLKGNPEALRELEIYFSINVTRFFRNYGTFEQLETHYLPQLIARKRKKSEGEEISIKVWSVGCANGSEPYTLAILFSRLLGDQAPERVRILATDYNPAQLQFAKEGIYPADLLKEVPPAILKRYFTEHSPNHYQIDPRIKQMVQFRFHDLLKDKPQGLQDVIVCRNVLIYFALEPQLKIYNELSKCLLPQGLLILGRTEVLHVQFGLPFKSLNSRHRIYQKSSPRIG